MFQGKQRPSGMEFPCCAACNNGTSAADLVAGFFARLSQKEDQPDWKAVKAQARRDALERKAPGFLEEFFDGRRASWKWMRSPDEILRSRVMVKANGPLTKAYLDVFAAKFGMALYREHCGAPIPLEGGILSATFLNAGLSQDTAHAMLAILPSGNTLVQGARNSAHDQFFYRFNTDQRTVVAALASFHDGLYVCTVAFSDRELYGGLLRPPLFRFVRPGELAGMMPAPARSASEQLTCPA